MTSLRTLILINLSVVLLFGCVSTKKQSYMTSAEYSPLPQTKQQKVLSEVSLFPKNMLADYTPVVKKSKTKKRK